MNNLHHWPNNLGSMDMILTKREVRNEISLFMGESISERLGNGGSNPRSLIFKGLRMTDRDYLRHIERQIYGRDVLDGVPEKIGTFMTVEKPSMARWSSPWKKPNQDSKGLEIDIRQLEHTEVRFYDELYKPPCQKEKFEGKNVIYQLTLAKHYIAHIKTRNVL